MPGTYYIHMTFSADKEAACNAGDLGSIPGLGRSPGEGIGSPLQYSGLESSMDCIVHGVAKSWTRLSDFHFSHVHLMKQNQLNPHASPSHAACWWGDLSWINQRLGPSPMLNGDDSSNHLMGSSENPLIHSVNNYGTPILCLPLD